VVLPARSVSVVVTSPSPGYHASSNVSVFTIRSGGTISRYTPRTPISPPLPFRQTQR
jgi:hypothetical protein